MSKNLQRALAAALIVGFLVRIWRLGSLPAGIHPDEMAGLVGVLDELSGRAPLRPFFDYRIFYLPLTGIGEYLSSLFFGFNAWAYRFPSVLYGLATIVCTAGLTYRFTRDRLASVLAAAVSAILPWEITVSRIAWENATMLPFLLGGLWALRAGLEDRKVLLLVLGGALLAIDAYSYRAALPDACILGLTLVIVDRQDARAMHRWLWCAGGVFLLGITPLVRAVLGYPSFFWRDAYISTFHDGITASTLAVFFHNYFAHFMFGPLFFFGDGNAEHGPSFGVLYLWMLPFIILGFIRAWQRSRADAAFLTLWLAIYPLGGALTNDGVPHFLRTLAGAPLAAILCAWGAASAWRSVATYALGRVAAACLAVLIGISFSQFCQSYFIAYERPAAHAFASENRDLFTTIRHLAAPGQRVCFEDIDEMNSLTLYAYYLRDLHLELHDRLDAACFSRHTLLVVRNRSMAPPTARLLATAQDYDGVVRHFIFLTME